MCAHSQKPKQYIIEEPSVEEERRSVIRSDCVCSYRHPTRAQTKGMPTFVLFPAVGSCWTMFPFFALLAICKTTPVGSLLFPPFFPPRPPLSYPPARYDGVSVDHRCLRLLFSFMFALIACRRFAHGFFLIASKLLPDTLSLYYYVCDCCPSSHLRR